MMKKKYHDRKRVGPLLHIHKRPKLHLLFPNLVSSLLKFSIFYLFFSFDLTLCLLLFLNVDQRLKESRSINFGLIDWIVVTHL